MASNATDLHSASDVKEDHVLTPLANNLTVNEGQDSGSEHDSDDEIPFAYDYRGKQVPAALGHDKNNVHASKHQGDDSKVKKEPDALDKRGAENAKKKDAKKGGKK